MADTSVNETPESFYYRLVDRQDEQILSIRHTLFGDDTERMRTGYEPMSGNDNLDQTFITDTLDRLAHIIKAEEELQKKGWTFGGIPVTNLYQLMERYKDRRKRITKYITVTPPNGSHKPSNGSQE